jgi:acyl-CoA reductase-like NAD-dependent aldehyde dehydrogenase
MSVATTQRNFVGGAWVDAVEGGVEQVINPATGEQIAEVPKGTHADVDRAVAAAKEAFKEWRETTPGERATMNAARKLEFGTVWINDHIPLVSEMPHGGYKQSGYGKDLSMYSVEEYTQVKHVMAKID